MHNRAQAPLLLTDNMIYRSTCSDEDGVIEIQFSHILCELFVIFKRVTTSKCCLIACIEKVLSPLRPPLRGNFKTLFKRVLIYLQYGWAIRSSGAKIKIGDLTHPVGCCVFAIDKDKLAAFFGESFHWEWQNRFCGFPSSFPDLFLLTLQIRSDWTVAQLVWKKIPNHFQMTDKSFFKNVQESFISYALLCLLATK